MIIFVLICIVIVYCIVAAYTKRLKYDNFVLISGGIKSGKSMLSTKIVFKELYKRQFVWRIKCFFCKIFKKTLPEKPLLYSNVPIGRPDKDEYVPLDEDILFCRKRYSYRSVIYVSEASLLAGSKDIYDEFVNDYLLHEHKLFAHKTRGGLLIYDTQSPMDIHYTAKRSLSTYFYIYKHYKYPFFSVLKLREQVLIDGDHSSTIEMYDPDDAKHDGNKPLYTYIIFHKWWKYYDRYCYSALYDHLPVADDVVKTPKYRKTKTVLRYKTILQQNKKNK